MQVCGAMVNNGNGSTAMIEIKPDGEIDSGEKDKDKIDYLHPDGKPKPTAEQTKINEEELQKPVSRTALQEADGHHVCTESCLGKHDAQT